jgi:uncharacterized protein YgiM (DUF1202 family)
MMSQTDAGDEWTVRTPHVASFDVALAFAAGDVLTVEDRDTEWDGWLWCRDQAGVVGWTPAAYLARDGARGVALRDYDARELTVVAGETLTVHYEESGWAWCTRKSGESGWAPARCLSPGH